MSSGSIGSPWLEALDAAIDARVSEAPGRALMAAAAALTARYRGEDAPAPGSDVRVSSAAASRGAASRGDVPRESRDPGGRGTPGLPGAHVAHAAHTTHAAHGARGGRDRRDARAGIASSGLTEVERLAYLVVRAPATGAAVRTVLSDMLARGVGASAGAHAEAITGGEGDDIADGGAGTPRPSPKSMLSGVEAEDVSAGRTATASVSARSAATGGEQGDAGDGVIRTLLDLGAGPGVGLWAALDRVETLEAATLVERDAGSVALGQALAREAGIDQLLALTWRRGDLRDPLDLAPHDLVLLSYSIGELDEPAALALLERAWRLARVALVVIEPGTPRHAARLLSLRQRLIEHGARIAAPCPHARACPMTSPDWCHFAARLGRTRLHRQLKQGALSYEDEKYSYLVATSPEAPPTAAPAPARIVRRPEYHKGFVRLPLCATDGLRVDTVTKSQRDHYRAARDAAWGDAWHPAPRPARASDPDTRDAGDSVEAGARPRVNEE